MPEHAGQTARNDLGMQIPLRGRERHILDLGDVPARVVTHVFDVDTLLETAPLGMLESGAARPNVLITCQPQEIPELVGRLQLLAVQPVHVCTVAARPCWPDTNRGTLIVHDASALLMAHQIELYDWATARLGRAQVIALTTRALAPMVEDGHFLQALYTRLNVLQAATQAVMATSVALSRAGAVTSAPIATVGSAVPAVRASQ